MSPGHVATLAGWGSAGWDKCMGREREGLPTMGWYFLILYFRALSSPRVGAWASTPTPRSGKICPVVTSCLRHPRFSVSPQVCLHPSRPSHLPLGHPRPSSALASVFSNPPLHSSPRGKAGRRVAGWEDKELGQELGKRKTRETITSLQWFILLPCPPQSLHLTASQISSAIQTPCLLATLHILQQLPKYSQYTPILSL